MELSTEEMAILDGDEGYGKQKSMEILDTLGEIFRAKRLIPIRSAQVSGVSYKNLGEEGLEFIRGLSKDCQVSVLTTLNPAGCDLDEWEAMGIDPEFAERQRVVIETYKAFGILPSCSCTPYHDVNIPSLGDHVAWGESSAVCFINSVLGARTNREGGPSALAAAIIGRTPEYGYHLDGTRKATHIIDVEEGVTDLASLGYLVGKEIEDNIPYFKGLGPRPGTEDLKALCAALAASGSVTLFHIEGITPEADNALDPDRSYDPIHVTKEMVTATAASLTVTDEVVDLVAIGCPHASPEALKRIASILKGKEPRDDAPRLWVCTSRESHRVVPEAVKEIERFGMVVNDTCMVVSPIETLFKVTATNSAKAAHYLVKDKYGNQKVRFMGLEEVLSLLY